ncbi:CapA family protein [Candidatus Nomurabacteria bacterium]|nr:CapA family protein [Candidatus Nomurabacteria bacterium]
MALSSKNKLLPILIGILLVTLCLWGRRNALAPTQVSSPQQTPPQSITLVLAGDIMMDRGVRRSIEKNFAGDYHALFAHTPYIAAADIAFGNFEGTAALGGRNVGSRFSFHMNPVSVEAFRSAGFDIVSFANNHVGDWDRAAFDETMQHLADNSILYAGAGKNYADASTVRVITVRGVRVGFLAATDVGPNWLAATATQPGILLASDPHLSEVIAVAKAQVDVLAVSFHFGNEYSPANSRQEALARGAIDAGADIVIGSHPHVMQRVEEYNGKLIYYSLGNFIFDQYFSLHTMRGMVATVTIDPQTFVLTHKEEVSPLSKEYIPQPLVPFDASMLVTKTFTP